MDLHFKPLDHAPWIMNAVVPVNEHFQISVSKGDDDWYVGKDGSYEAAIQVIDPVRYPGVADLVCIPGNPQSNIYSRCSMTKVAWSCSLCQEFEEIK